MTRIHWCGTGLSAAPGLRRLIAAGRAVTVWNRTVENGEAAVAGLAGDFTVKPFNLDALACELAAGDLAVSMLPGDFHVPIAEACLAAGAHFVSSSYIADPMRALDAKARAAGLCLVNEVGLDPGIDHLLAHAMIAQYRQAPTFSPDNRLTFRSYCGGLSKVANDFCYKFSWSPLGVLKALRSPSKSLAGGQEWVVARPWDAISDFEAPLPWGRETFEVYPNRDSLPFMEEYGFDANWPVDIFVRGTLRYKGWAVAWADIFAEVETLCGAKGDARLAELSTQLWHDYRFAPGEADRVVLCVELKAQSGADIVWHKTYVLDAFGNKEASAMARLVSIPVSLAVEAVLDGEIEAGVSAAPQAPKIVEAWLEKVAVIADNMELVDHLA